MKKIYLLPIFLIMTTVIFFQTSAIYSEPQLKDIKQNTYVFLSYVEEKRYDSAVLLLENISKQLDVVDITVNQALQKKINETIHTLNSTSSTMELKRDISTQLVLLLDAQWNKEDPLWLIKKAQLEDEILLALESNTNEFISDFESVKTTYNHIFPVILTNTTPNNKDEIVSLYNRMNNAHHLEEKEMILQELYTSVHAVNLEEIKGAGKNDTALLWLISSVGGLIISTLIYVAWRKYKGEKQKQREQHKKVDGQG